MTAIFPGWMVVKQRVVNDAVMVLLWRLVVGTPVFCLVRNNRLGARGGWHYRNGWVAKTVLADWDGTTPPMAGEWKDFEARL